MKGNGANVAFITCVEQALAAIDLAPYAKLYGTALTGAIPITALSANDGRIHGAGAITSANTISAGALNSGAIISGTRNINPETAGTTYIGAAGGSNTIVGSTGIPNATSTTDQSRIP